MQTYTYVFLESYVFLYLIELAHILWGITGSGDKIEEIIDSMIHLKNEDEITITVAISKAGEQVLRRYNLWNLLHESFSKVYVETSANIPFIAGPLQIGKYDLLVIAPLTANSTAKIAHGIADTLITNAVAQTLKGRTPVLLYPVDQSSTPIETTSPDGIKFSLTPRAIDLDNVERLRTMTRVTILTSPALLKDQVRILLTTN